MFHSIMLQFFYTKKKEVQVALLFYIRPEQKAPMYEAKRRESKKKDRDLQQKKKRAMKKRNENETVVPLKS